MKNLIYQSWDGPITSGCKAGIDWMSAYAKRIGADFIFDHDKKFVTNLGKYSPNYGCFRPIFTKEFHKYDNILFTDCDVYPVEKLEENPFEGFEHEIGICTEPFQPKFRAARSTGRTTKQSEEKWAAIVKKKWGVDLPRTKEGLLKVYNGGMVLYSNAALVKARERFIPFTEYTSWMKQNKMHIFYTGDQNYLHVMLDYCKFDWGEMDNDWNCSVHFLGDPKQTPRPVNDMRTPTTKLVHVQLRGADNWDSHKLWRVVNLPVSQWRL